MKKEFLAILLFVKFGFNFSNPKEFIPHICKQTNKTYLTDHLVSKFNHLYKTFGSHAVMFCFIYLSVGKTCADLQEALVEYAINVYAPHGMSTRYEEYKSL